MSYVYMWRVRERWNHKIICPQHVCPPLSSYLKDHRASESISNGVETTLLRKNPSFKKKDLAGIQLVTHHLYHVVKPF